VVGALRASEVVDDLQFLEIIGIDVGFDRLRRIAHLQGIADIAGVEPRLASVIDLTRTACASNWKE
jgi:hypothetical protein